MTRPPGRAIELVGIIDAGHRLNADVPEELPAGQVRIILLVPEQDDADADWASGIVWEWAADFEDPREDLYTVEDGQPVSFTRESRSTR